MSYVRANGVPEEDGVLLAQIQRPRTDPLSPGEKSRLRPETFRARVAVVLVRFSADCRFGRGRSYASSLRREGSTSREATLSEGTSQTVSARHSAGRVSHLSWR